MKYLVLVVMVLAVAACKERQESAKAPTPSSSEQTATGATQSPGIAAGPAQSMSQPSATEPSSSAKTEQSSGSSAASGTSGTSDTSGASGTSEDMYTVAAGDTLSGIAKSHGVTYQDIARWNDIKDPNQIHEGQALRMTAP